MFDGETISIDSAKKISGYVGLEVRELFDIKEEIKPLMFNTKKKYTDFLSKMLSYAKKYGYIAINYFSQENIDMFKEKKRNKDEKCMSFTEFKKYNEYLLNNLDVEDSCVVANLILVETGLRKEELLGLKWSNVDFVRKLFVVRNTVTYNNITKKNINEDETKNDSSFRIVSISNTLVEVLTKYKEHQEKVIASNPNKTVDVKNNWLFMNLKSGKYFGELIFPSTVNSWVNRITELAGIAHYTPHNIRHTYITYLIETGKFSIVEVSRRVGHSDANTTLKVYAHVMHMQDESKTELSYIESIVQREKEKNDADIKKDIIPNGDLETRIARLKKLYDENNITEEQYNRRVNEILSEI